MDPVLAPWGSVQSGSSRSHVALTIDDGPDPTVTAELLDLMRTVDVHASWFLLSARAEQYPHLVRRMVDEGHEVALHGLDHRRVSTMSTDEAYAYLESARDRLASVAQRPVTRYRPPYGSQSLASYRAATRLGLEVVVWSADGQDWVDRPATTVAAEASAATEPGGILLLHERLEPDPLRGSPVTTFDRAAMVREVHALMAARGLTLCSVAELEARGRLRKTAWFRP